MKYNKLYLLPAVVCVLFCLSLITGCHGANSVYRRDYDMTPLCADSGAEKLSVERDTKIEFYRLDSNAPAAHISEIFTIHNSGGEAAQLPLIYPSVLYAYPDELPAITIDGSICTDWWGVAGSSEIEQARAAGTLVRDLDSGAYFQRAFPNWPALGEQSHGLSDQGTAEGIDTVYCLSYYIQKVSVPPDGQITVTVEYDARFLSTARILRLKDEIPCARHTLTITNKSDSDGVRITEQNLLDILPEQFPWTTDLSPEKTDYFITVD